MGGTVFRSYVDNAVIDDKDLKKEIEQSREHKEAKSAYLRVDSTVPDKCSSIPSSSLFTQFACFSPKNFVGPRPIWVREFGCFCTFCRDFNFKRCLNLDIVGPWHLKFVEECHPRNNENLSRSNFRSQLNKWIRSSRKSSRSNIVIIAILGNHSDIYENDDSYGVEGEYSYWLAEAKTLVRKAKKIIDPADNPGDVISKGHYFISVQYYSLVNFSSFKYQVSDMPLAVVDFDNVITTARIDWNKIFRGNSGKK